MKYTFDSLYFNETEIATLYLGDTVVWSSVTVEPPPSVYDETCISVVPLDSGGEPIGDVRYFTSIADVVGFLRSMSNDRFLVHIGNLSGITSIGAFAFDHCISLAKIDVPECITSIGDAAFQGCSSLGSIIIPSSITSINAATFLDCSSLTNVVISSGVTSIVMGNNGPAFGRCTALTSITIPSTVTSIGNPSFYGCTSLTTITIEKPENSISDSPWGATNATIVWTG